MNRHFVLFVLLLCLSSVIVSNDVQSDLFLNSQNVIFDGRYPAANTVTSVARHAELSLTDSIYAYAHRPGSLFHGLFSRQLVVPTVFLLTMILKHRASFQAERKETLFLAAVEHVPVMNNIATNVPHIWTQLKIDGQKAQRTRMSNLMRFIVEPLVVLLGCVLLNHVVIQGTLFYTVPTLDDVGHFKKLLGYSASLETFFYAFVANLVASEFYDPVAKNTAGSAAFVRLVFLCAVRRFMRDWAPRVGGTWQYLELCAYAFAFKYVLREFSSSTTAFGLRFTMAVVVGFVSYAIAIHLRDSVTQDWWTSLIGAIRDPAVTWQQGSRIVRPIWMFFLEDVHYYAGFSVASWNNAFEKYQKESLSIPTIMTSADTTFLLFIYGTEQMKYFYQYQQYFQTEAHGGVVLCPDNTTMAVPRKCMNTDFYQQSYSVMQAPEAVPRHLFSKVLGLTSENLTYTANIDVWVADYCYHAIRTSPLLFAVFSSRLIVPVTTVLAAAIVYYQKMRTAADAPPTMKDLTQMPLTDAVAVKADFTRYLVSKKLELKAIHEDPSYQSKSVPSKRTRKHHQDLAAKLAVTEEKLSFRTVAKKFLMPFLISFVYFFFQQVLMQAHMYYHYDKTPEAAAKIVMDAIFPIDYVFTYTIATPIADSFWFYRPKPNGAFNFLLSLLYGIGYYFIRRYGRGLRSRNYLDHFFGKRAVAIKKSLLFSTNILSSITLAVATAFVYSLGGPIQMISLVSTKLAGAIHRLLSSPITPVIVIALFTQLVLSQAEVSLQHFQDPKNSMIALNRCVTVMWNFLKIDFQYAATYIMAGWPSYVTLFDSISSQKMAHAAGEAMKIMVLYAGEMASAKPVPLTEFVSQ